MPGELVSATLAAFPGAAVAFSRVLGGIGGAGAAWIDIVKAEGERRAANIRDETAARSLVMKKMSTSAAQQIGKSPERMDRALTVWLGERYDAQENREEIVLEAEKILSESPPGIEVNTAPDEDWFNVYIPFAEKATSDALRKTWARVLAGEIRKPGTFSLRTLQFISILDKELASIVQSSANSLVNGVIIPEIPQTESGKRYTDLITLESVGLVKIGTQISMVAPHEGTMLLTFSDTHVITFACVVGLNISIPGAALTALGAQVFELVEGVADAEAMGAFVDSLNARLGLGAVVRERSELPFFAKGDRNGKALSGHFLP